MNMSTNSSLKSGCATSSYLGYRNDLSSKRTESLGHAKAGCWTQWKAENEVRAGVGVAPEVGALARRTKMVVGQGLCRGQSHAHGPALGRQMHRILVLAMSLGVILAQPLQLNPIGQEVEVSRWIACK